MRAAYISDDFYICFSKKSLNLLKQDTQLTIFMVYKNKIFTFLIKILKNKKNIYEPTRLLISKKLKIFKLELEKKDFADIFEKGYFPERIGSTNVYIYTEYHNPLGYNEKSNQINNEAFILESLLLEK
jgi:hypothetical protein